MGIEIPIVKALIDLLVSVLKGATGKRSEKGEERRAAQLVSEAISELLKIYPDIVKARVLICQADKILLVTNEDLERAREMLNKWPEASSP